jgi:hypothetical protein
MADEHDIPWKTFPRHDGGQTPLFIVQFDEHGSCTSPLAREAAVQASRDSTDVFLFSHGWNNDWAAATDRYDRFIDAFIEVRSARWDPPTRPFRPVLIGVFWPSAALVAPWEHGPDIAAMDPEVARVRELIAPDKRERFDQLLDAPDLDAEELRELAGILAPVLPDGSEERGATAAPATADDLPDIWLAIESASGDSGSPPVPAGGFIPDDGPAPAGPAAAGFNPFDLVRKAIRLATVLQMKDRAGRVGGTGVADLLRELAKKTEPLPAGADGEGPRIHLVGHSYGAKVVLSALCNGPAPERVVDSVLLLEPALSCYAFTDNLEGHAGGYRSAFERTRQPIISTFSDHDEPLTKFFHLAVRRSSDLAEARIAGAPPSKFAALGGFGPQGVPAEELSPMPDVGQAYPLATPHRIIGVDGSAYISNHGAVENAQTAWALLNQVSG